MNIFKKLSNIVGRCIINNVDSNSVAKIDSGDKESLDSFFMQHFGFASKPIPGTQGVFLSIGGNRGNTVVIASEDTDTKFDVEAGEVAIYNAIGDVVHISKKGIKIESKTTIDINGSAGVNINGNTKSLVTHAELDVALQTFVALLNAHTHLGNLGSPTAPPTIPMTLNITPAQTLTVKTGG